MNVTFQPSVLTYLGLCATPASAADFLSLNNSEDLLETTAAALGIKTTQKDLQALLQELPEAAWQNGIRKFRDNPTAIETTRQDRLKIALRNIPSREKGPWIARAVELQRWGVPDPIKTARLEEAYGLQLPLGTNTPEAAKRLFIIDRTNELLEAGVPNATDVAELEQKWGFEIDFDPEAIAKRAEELAKNFEVFTLPVPTAFWQLSQDQRNALFTIGKAIRLLDTPCRIQSNPEGEIFERLVMETPGLEPLRIFYKRLGGVYDFQNPDASGEFHSFLPGMEKIVRAPGGGVYPVEIRTQDDFRRYVPEGSPMDMEMRAIFRFDEAGKLIAIPYSEYFKKWLAPAADLLEEAAGLLQSSLPNTALYLKTVVQSFRTNDFQNADRAWVRHLPEGPLDMGIGAVEQYVDKVRGFMAELAGVIQIRNPQSEVQLSAFKKAFPDFEEALPVEDVYKKPMDQRRPPPLSAVENLMAAGHLLGGEILPRAYNQPNDSEVRTDTGIRIVLMENIGDARDEKNRFNQTLTKIAFDDDQRGWVTTAGSRTFVLLHELSHGHGTEYVVGQPEVQALKAIGSDLRTTFEELKADIVGLFDAQTALTQNLISEQLFKEIYVTYIARCLGTILSRGIEESHAKGALVALHYFLEQGAVTIDPNTGKTRVDLEKMCFAVQEFCHLLLTIKGNGDREQAVALYEKYGTVLPKGLDMLSEQLQGIPKDIIVQYEFARLVDEYSPPL